MPYFSCPANPRRQQELSSLDPIVQLYLAQRGQNRPTTSKSNETKSCSPQNSAATGHSKANEHHSTFSPNFDVYETSTSYLLEGDLPGMSDKKHLDINFSNDRTVTISGRLDKPRPVVTPVTGNNTDDGTAPEEQNEDETKLRRRSLNPTVEDTDDEDDFSIVHSTSTSSKEKGKSVKPDEIQKRKERNEPAQQEPPRKVWLSERSFGNFQRSFSFPCPVDLDSVTAKLEDGVLKMSVPKVVFTGVRKIEID